MQTENNKIFQGVELDVPDASYRAAEGFSCSEMKEFARTPAHYRALKENPKPTTPARRIGILSHLAVFEPDAFDATTIVAPVVNKRTNAGKEILAQFEQANAGKDMVSQDEFDLVRSIADAVRAHPLIKEHLEVGFAEVSVWAREPETQVLCKGRLDWLTGDGLILDLKTTEDAGQDAFARNVVKLKYDLQAAHYTRLLADAGRAASDFLFIAAEKSPPFGVAVYKLYPEDIEQALSERRVLLHRFAECLNSDSWPGYDEPPMSLSLPGWSRKRSQD